MNYSDGSKYEGEWIDNKANGKGIMYNENEIKIYVGEFKDDKAKWARCYLF